MALAAAAIIAGTSVISAYMANKEQARSNEDARRMFDEAMAELNRVTPPGSEERKVALERMKVEGKLAPEMEQAVAIQDSEMGGITTDPRFSQIQMDTLAKMSDAASGELNDADKARLEQITSAQQAENRGMQDAIGQNLRSRGLGSSGMEAALRSQAVQSGADRARGQAMDVNAMASNRALQALADRGRFASGLRSQEFGEKAQQATAQDAINRFRAQNLQGVNQRNVNAARHAAETNLREQQRVSDANVGIANYEQERNTDVGRELYQDKLDKARIAAGAAGGAADRAQRGGSQKAKMWGDLIQGAGTAASSYFKNKDKDDKEG